MKQVIEKCAWHVATENPNLCHNMLSRKHLHTLKRLIKSFNIISVIFAISGIFAIGVILFLSMGSKSKIENDEAQNDIELIKVAYPLLCTIAVAILQSYNNPKKFKLNSLEDIAEISCDKLSIDDKKFILTLA